MQYKKKLAAAGVLAALAGMASAGSGVVPGWPNDELWWSWADDENPPTTFFQPADESSNDGSSLFIIGNNVVLGKSEESWQSISGVDNLVLLGKNISVYAAETDLQGALSISGNAKWIGAPVTPLHHICTISFDNLSEESEENSLPLQLDLLSGFTVTEAVQWSSDSVLQLHGFDPQFEGGTIGSGAMLAVKGFSSMADTGDFPSLKVKMTGNSALVLGNGAYTKYAEQGVDGVKSLKALITEASIQGNSERASLITASPTIDGLADGVTIEVGTAGKLPGRSDAADRSPRVIIGEKGRWILSLPDAGADTVMLLDAEGAAPTKVEALAGAELYLTGWDGRDLTAIQLDSSWQGKQLFIANSLFLGDAVVDGNGTLSITHRAWSELSGLTAREILGEAEAVFLQGGEGVVTDIGRRYLADVMRRISSVQNEYVIARSIDETVFLAGSSGLLSAADRSHRRLHFGLLEHDPEMVTADDDLYWWAQAYGGHGSMDKLRSGSDWGFKEDFYGGTLGADWRFAPKWIATAAVSGATSDIDGTGRGVEGEADSDSASLTMAAAGASLTYLADDHHRLHAAVTYSQTQGEAKKISTEYRMKTEPDFRMLSADLGWSAHYAVADNVQVKPSVFVGMDTGRMRKGDITLSTQDGTTSGVGFVQTTDSRRMWHLKGRLETSGKFSVWRYNVEPGVNAGFTLYGGDTDWRVASRLAEGTVVSRETFHATGHWALSGGLNLRISDAGREPIMEGGIFGFGAKNTGKSRAYAWSLDLSAAAETGPYGTQAASFGVRYRELF